MTTKKTELTKPQNSAAILSIIDRISSTPDFQIENVERFFALYEKQCALEARKSYLSAFSEMQPELPVIDRKGTIKDKLGNTQSRHAKWEDVVEGITPILARHGFGISFKLGVNDANLPFVEANLSHKDGHIESASLPLPLDTTGSKNAVQAVGSSTSYAKRYLAFGLLNVVARGEDDDAQSAVPSGVITNAQQGELRALIDETNSDIGRFLHVFEASNLAEMHAKHFDKARGMLMRKKVKLNEAREKADA